MSRPSDLRPNQQKLLREFYRNDTVHNPSWASLRSLIRRGLIEWVNGNYRITSAGREKIHKLNDYKARRMRPYRSRFNTMPPRAPQYDGWSFA